MTDNIFKEQIKEDIGLLQSKLAWDPNISKPEYAFNYWILSNIYNLDEEDSNTNITEYNDKGIDCFVHFEEDKELYIIQNKYYSDENKLNSKELSDFLTRPLAKLNEGNYKRSPELQKIYDLANKDSEYKIFLHFFVTNNHNSEDLDSIIKDHNSDHYFADIFYLKDIKEKYFGKSFKENNTLKTKLAVKNKGTYLAIRPEEYSLPNMSEAYYVMAKITDVYSLWKEAQQKKYPLFEENIREYLGGTSGINKGIITTLKNEDERGNFFYYNNGITIICDKAKAESRKVEITNPQIVNGCQTVNSIAEVLKAESDVSIKFNDVYVMVKILVLKNKSSNFYRDIVKYTNSQNSINYKVFGATLKPFFKIQEKIKDFGFLLAVKQSDKFQNKSIYKDVKELGVLLGIARKNVEEGFLEFKNLSSIQMPLETLLQIIGAFEKDAHFAFTKKTHLLKPSSKEYYQNFSMTIGDIFTIESMAKLVILYKKSEVDKRDSEDRRSPAPYYLLNFIGYYLKEKNISKQNFLKEVSKEEITVVYEKFKILSSKYFEKYKEKYNLEYNQIIKLKVDEDIMKTELNNHLASLKEYNKEDFDKLNAIFSRIAKLNAS